MNPLDSIVIRSLAIYIQQLESQIGEMHSQLLEKSRELEESRKAKAPRKGR